MCIDKILETFKNLNLFYLKKQKSKHWEFLGFHTR